MSILHFIFRGFGFKKRGEGYLILYLKSYEFIMVASAFILTSPVFRQFNYPFKTAESLKN